MIFRDRGNKVGGGEKQNKHVNGGSYGNKQ